MSEERKKLTLEEAQELLPEGDAIHTFLQTGNMLIGAGWSRHMVIDAIKEHGIELSGEQATKMNHGLVLWDGKRNVFIQTRKTER